MQTKKVRGGYCKALPRGQRVSRQTFDLVFRLGYRPRTFGLTFAMVMGQPEAVSGQARLCSRNALCSPVFYCWVT